jgi:hypothetical protein
MKCTTRVAGDRQVRQMTKTSSVCATLCEVIDEIVFRRYQQNMSVGWKRSQYSTQRFEHALPLSLSLPMSLVAKSILANLWWASATFLGLVIARHFPISATKKCSDRSTIREKRRSYCKNDENTDRVIDKWCPGMLPKALWTLEKVYHSQTEGFARKYNLLFSCNKSIPSTFWSYSHIRHSSAVIDVVFTACPSLLLSQNSFYCSKHTLDFLKLVINLFFIISIGIWHQNYLRI